MRTRLQTRDRLAVALAALVAAASLTQTGVAAAHTARYASKITATGTISRPPVGVIIHYCLPPCVPPVGVYFTWPPYEIPAYEITGFVTSNRTECVANRVVTVYHRHSGSTQVVWTGTTSRYGFYAARDSVPKPLGEYFAKVRKHRVKTRRHDHTCAEATSPSFGPLMDLEPR